MGNPHVRVQGAVEMDTTGRLLTVCGRDGVSRPVPPKPDLTQWVEAASSDPDVALVLAMAASDAVRWAVLYRIVECVKRLAGKDWEAAVGAHSARSEALFSYTASVPAPGGVDKRHAPLHQPPSSPMLLADAELYARQVAAAFLRWKAEQR